MSEKIGGALFALVFMVCFGGVGLFAGSVMVSGLWEGIAAQDWIRVKAQVVKYDSSGLQYRYRLNDRDYTGDRIGPGWLQGSEVDGGVEARLNAAMSQEKPVTVFVDPDNPSKSLVDPQIPWTMMAFLTPFAFGFGGVGLGALYMLFKILSGGDEKKERFSARKKVVKSSAGSETLGIWIFTFFWNVISFPIALIAVPEILRSGEWLGLLVLIFPAIGVLLLWGSISSTVRMLRRGPANLVLASQEPRMGLPVSGHIAFPRGVKRGDHFRAKLSAHAKQEGSSTAVQAWSKDASVQAVEASDGPRVNFRFDVPSRLPTAIVDPDEYEDLTWRLELFLPTQTREAAFSFGLELAPAPDLEAGEEPALVAEEAVPAGLPAEFQGLSALVGKDKLDSMSARDRAKLHALAAEFTPQQREQVAKLVNAGPLIKKLVIAIVILVVVVQVVGALVALGFTS